MLSAPLLRVAARKGTITPLFCTIARRALGLPDMERTPFTASAAQLAACAGVYKFAFGEHIVTVADGALTVTSQGGAHLYRPCAENCFWLDADPEHALTFEDLQNGSYQRVVSSGYGAFVGERISDAART